MKYYIYSLLVLFGMISPTLAQTNTDEYGYVVDVVDSLKVIFHNDKNKEAAQAILARIKGAKPLMKDNHYQGHQVIRNGALVGFIGIEYRDSKPFIAVYSTPLLRVRKATRRYNAYRSQLQKHYKEREYNLFDLGNQVTARLKKQANKITIDVYRER